MSLNLPEPIAAYFSADTVGAEAVARCFTEDSVLVDKRQAHKGRSAIHQWKATTEYSYVSEPFAIESHGPNTTVTSRVTGDFPGSPLDLRYIFVLDGEMISRLEIVV